MFSYRAKVSVEKEKLHHLRSLCIRSSVELKKECMFYKNLPNEVHSAVKIQRRCLTGSGIRKVLKSDETNFCRFFCKTRVQHLQAPTHVTKAVGVDAHVVGGGGPLDGDDLTGRERVDNLEAPGLRASASEHREQYKHLDR